MRFDLIFSLAHTDTHALTDSSRPGLRGLKLQEMIMVLGLMGEELWNVHFRRTSVPLTASTSPEVYIRIPLTCSTPARHKHKAQSLAEFTSKSLLHRAKSIHRLMVCERNTNIQRNICSMNSASSVNSCVGSACSVPSDPPSAYAVLLQEKSLTLSCHYSRIRYIYNSVYRNLTDWFKMLYARD